MDIDPQLVKHVVDVGASAWASKEVIAKIIGPTADYLGGEIKNFTQKCNVNLSEVFERAKRKLGPRIDDPAQVNPRVLKGVLSEGAFAEDEIAAEYFGGVLAASRSQDGADDRGVAFLGLIRDLSIYQLRFHYLFYSWVRHLFVNSGLQLGLPKDRAAIRLFILMPVFTESVNFSERAASVSRADHCILGLARHGLIDASYVYGAREHVVSAWSRAPSAGMVLSPSPFGGELFLWAHGWGDRSINELLVSTLELSDTSPVEVPRGVCAISDERQIDMIHADATKLAEDIKAFRARVESAIANGLVPPGLPNDLKAEAQYVIEEIRVHINELAEPVLTEYLDDYLYPPENRTFKQRLESLANLASMALSLTSEEEGEAGDDSAE